MPLSRLRLVIITLLLAAVALWLSKPERSLTTDTQAPLAQLPYSWQTQDTTIWQLQSNTLKAQNIIHSERFTYQNDDKRADFTKPKLWLLDDNSLTQLQSEKGFSLNNQLITFEEQVIITQNRTNNKTDQAQQLQTERLSYNQQTQQLYTDADVTLIQSNGVTTATGLEIDIEAKEYRLLSNVKGLYDVHQTLQTDKTDSK
ncbi:LPS export ABC transporter periplasmic protein LptC [Thiomicrorhabdus sediminis]|uniref:LPS export ABC transporter periplasmic protein LptC n=1 Tax=Thiomicrorhabdus sediminis TaxID=2580412 RepID=A0A4P9K4G3_9GAMM|nr:LPS export ABC transporter periplasmic protein LptC [Thiomicrorhabdus sediminis]QCU89611.1 LPS export ABC transporter periplasmic protein LptC [Thiomicrorhabdus sediminis]